jgi:hypothetical protein
VANSHRLRGFGFGKLLLPDLHAGRVRRALEAAAEERRGASVIAPGVCSIPGTLCPGSVPIPARALLSATSNSFMLKCTGELQKCAPG